MRADHDARAATCGKLWAAFGHKWPCLRTFYRQKLPRSIATQLVWPYSGDPILVLSFFQPSLLPHFLTVALLPLINLLLFIYWFPLLLCLLGARYEDFFQLVPIVMQLMFLLTPILYQKETLGSLAWTADLNPLYMVLSNFRHALIQGDLKLDQALPILLLNIFGVFLSVSLLERQRRELPFLV